MCKKGFYIWPKLHLDTYTPHQSDNIHYDKSLLKAKEIDELKIYLARNNNVAVILSGAVCGRLAIATDSIKAGEFLID